MQSISKSPREGGKTMTAKKKDKKREEKKQLANARASTAKTREDQPKAREQKKQQHGMHFYDTLQKQAKGPSADTSYAKRRHAKKLAFRARKQLEGKSVGENETQFAYRTKNPEMEGHMEGGGEDGKEDDEDEDELFSLPMR